MFLILQTSDIKNGLINFKLPQYTFDEKENLEFRIVDCYISLCNKFKETIAFSPKFSTVTKTPKTNLLSLQSNLVDKTSLNPFQDLFFVSVPPLVDFVHYQPTYILRYKLKLYDLNDLFFKINSSESVISRIDFISIQIEIISYGRI